ncbi:unnamed protein product [Caenorhabditis brenneri]
MSMFYREGVPDGEEAIELAEPRASTSTEQPVVTQQPLPIEKSIAETTEEPMTSREPIIPSLWYFAVQLTPNLITRLLITDCRELKDRSKPPLRNNNCDIIFYEDEDFDNTVSPDIMESGPEVDISELDPDFFARILKKALLEDHKEQEPRKSLVVTYPGRYHRQRETELLNSIRALELFEKVYCLPESSVYHELYYDSKTADDYGGEVPCVLYASVENSWFFASKRDAYYIGDDERSLCSGFDVVMAGIECFFRMRSNPDTGPHQRELLVMFESLLTSHFDLQHVEDVQRVVGLDRKKTSALALHMDPRTCFVSRKAFIAVRENMCKVLKSIFGAEEERCLRIICVGKFFSTSFKKFKFYADIDNLSVKWQKSTTASLDDIPSAATCLGALHDGIDLLKSEASELVTRVIHRTDLSFELGAPIPSGDVEY